MIYIQIRIFIAENIKTIIQHIIFFFLQNVHSTCPSKLEIAHTANIYVMYLQYMDI